MEVVTEKVAAGLIEIWCQAMINRPQITESTRQAIQRKTTALSRFLNSDDPVTEKTVSKILRKGKGQYSYRHRLASMLRQAMEWCVENLLIKINPLFKIQLPRPRFNHRKYFLTREELDSIIHAPLAGRLAEIRDYFIIQCLTGLAYADVTRLSKFDLYHAAGRQWIRIVRKKSHQTAAIPVTIELMDLLERYNWILNIPNNQEYNERLKEVQLAAGIEKSLHSHLACKTFVQHYLHKGLHVEETAKMRGITAKTLIEHYGTLDERNLSMRLSQLGL